MAFGKHPHDRRSFKRVGVRRRLLVERLNSRRVLAAITGVVFEDLDQSFRQEAEESVLSNRLVYLDANNNASLDSGERFVLTQDDGSFQFDDLDDGEYLLRLFNGSQSQTQTSPVNATLEHATIPTVGAVDLVDHESGLLSLVQDSIVVGNLDDGTFQSIPVGDQLTELQLLPSGDVIVIGGEVPNETAWIVNPQTQSVSSIDLSGTGGTFAWSGLAIDANGNGVVLNQGAGFSTIVAIDGSDPDAQLQLSNVDFVLPPDTQVIASDSGNRSVFGWNGPTGLQLSLWSNPTATFITDAPIELAGTSELLAYDDASGLLVLRTDDGGVSLHDTNASFAQLQSLPNATGVVALDGQRELLVAISNEQSSLELIDLRNAETVAILDVDLSTVGEVGSLIVESNAAAILVQGSSGATRISLSQPTAHEILVSGGVDPEPVTFGLTIDGENSAPLFFSVTPEFSVDEDQVLTAGAPGALEGSIDPDGDQYVIFLAQPASNGDVSLQLDGSLIYQPDENFNGVDTISVVLHDGASSTVTPLDLTVNPVADEPVGIDIDIPPFPVNIANGQPLGVIDVIDPDNDNHEIIVHDGRFEVRDGQLVFIGEPGDLNLVDEPNFSVLITATDPDTATEVSTTVSLSLTLPRLPIVDITPHTAGILENSVGGRVTPLVIHDENFDTEHIVTVDDERFEVVNGELRLVDGVALDFETERSVTIAVTAAQIGVGGNSFTQEITVAVGDLPEQIETVTLNSDSVVELELGAIVGGIEIDGNSSGNFVVEVDDSRFEVVDLVLKLKDDVFVERAVEDEIQIVVTAQNLNRSFQPVSETFLIEVVDNSTPFHNDSNPHDVDGSGEITAIDALIIINYLNTYGPGPVGEGDPALGYDVNLDGIVSALDALLVLNELERIAAEGPGGTVGNGDPNEIEGEDPSGTNGGGLNEILAEGEAPSVAPQESGQDNLSTQNFAQFTVNDSNETGPNESPSSDLLAPFRAILQLPQEHDATADEMKDLVLQNARLLGLADTPVSIDQLSADQLELNYQVIKAVQAEAGSGENISEQFAKDIDASLESYLDSQE